MGKVKVAMNGRHEVSRVQIDASLMGDDKEMLEDLVAFAFCECQHGVAFFREGFEDYEYLWLANGGHPQVNVTEPVPSSRTAKSMDSST